MSVWNERESYSYIRLYHTHTHTHTHCAEKDFSLHTTLSPTCLPAYLPTFPSNTYHANNHTPCLSSATSPPKSKRKSRHHRPPLHHPPPHNPHSKSSAAAKKAAQPCNDPTHTCAWTHSWTGRKTAAPRAKAREREVEAVLGKGSSRRGNRDV